MSIGTGIAIAGMWGCVAALGVTKQVTGTGFMFGMFAAIILSAVAMGTQ